jgi:hypothetical protein
MYNRKNYMLIKNRRLQLTLPLKPNVFKPVQKKIKRAGRMAQVVECLPIKCEALSSNSSMSKGKETIKQASLCCN